MTEWHEGCIDLSCNKVGCFTLGKDDPMFANVLMLVMAIGTLVVPVLWVLRPARMVNPYSPCGSRLTFHPALTENSL
jgi:hypothetical protein